VVNNSAGYVDGAAVVERVKLLEIELAAAKLFVDGFTSAARKRSR
jgi:hypothetical protein